MKVAKLFNEQNEEIKKVDTVEDFMHEIRKDATSDWQSMLISALVIRHIAKKLKD